jgi:hypothetical protein
VDTLGPIALGGLPQLCDAETRSISATSRQYRLGRLAHQHAERLAALEDAQLVGFCNGVELACRHGVHSLIENPIALTMELAPG